jgi:hypothetical protein
MVKNNINDNTQVCQLTVSQLTEVIKSLIDSGSSTVQKERQYKYGLLGLSQILGCSIPTAQRLKSSGKIDGAYTQTGRKIIFDVEQTLKLANDNNKGGSL